MKEIIIKGWCATNFVDNVPIDEISFAKTEEEIKRRYGKQQRISKCEVIIYEND